MGRRSVLAATAATAVLAATTAIPAGAATGLAATTAVVTGPGSWSAPFTPPGANTRVIGVHSVMLYTGKVLVFGALRPTQAYVYDPATGQATETDPPADVECGAMEALTDGRILVVGGHAKGAKGINNILLFDPVSLSWTPQPSSPKGRYYPTATRLTDGRVLISGGFDSNGNPNPDMEVWTPPPAGGSIGTLQKVGGPWPSGLYPHQWVLPDGKVLEVTSRSTAVLDPSTWTWTSYHRPLFKHGSGEAAVLLPSGPAGQTKVMLFGGKTGTGATAAAETFDAANPTAGWSAVASMPQPRTHMSPVLMPDGSLMAVAGNSSGNFAGPIYTSLRYRFDTNTWETLAAQTMRRAYHSSAVLMPDGRVLSAGDTGSGGGGNTDEIYTPAYLTAGARPAIGSAPSQVANGATLSVGTPDTTSHLVLMAPGSSTHTVDFHERTIDLDTTATSGGVSATVPSGTVALPGWYLLFLVTDSGVPSTATWVHVG